MPVLSGMNKLCQRLISIITINLDTVTGDALGTTHFLVSGSGIPTLVSQRHRRKKEWLHLKEPAPMALRFRLLSVRAEQRKAKASLSPVPLFVLLLGVFAVLVDLCLLSLRPWSSTLTQLLWAGLRLLRLLLPSL